MASNDPPSGSASRGLVGRRGSNRGGRLPSLKGPRDLTLGGVQKKTFVPNIPVRPKERKDESKDSETATKSEKQRDHNRRGRGDRGRGRGERGRGRGRGRGEREIIQSHSIFEQGPSGESLKHKGSWGGGVEPVERTSSRTTSIKKEKKDPAETKSIIDNLLRDDFVAGSFSSEDPNLVPIKLPLCDIKGEIKSETMADIKVKEEVKEDGDISMEEKPIKSNVTPDRPKSAAELFTKPETSERGELIFIQLPDTLPGEPPEKDEKDQKSSKKQQPQQPPPPVPQDDDCPSNPQSELAKRLGLCSVQQFSEGYIGKVRVHQSGRTMLVLGNVELDVSLGTASGFLQDVVSIKTEEGSNDGDMMVLGHVTNKLVCVPDFEKMMDT